MPRTTKPAAKKPAVTKPQIHITAVSITPGEAAILRSLCAQVSDEVGRDISRSAVMRALLRWCGKQGVHFAHTHVTPEIERELKLVRWGGPRTS